MAKGVPANLSSMTLDSSSTELRERWFTTRRLYPLEHIQDAVRHLLRGGKILLKVTGDERVRIG
ncbi:hypothetical protein A5621_17675 [Mycobacterium colombiense]|nr:hypothetical protein A9W93_24855 [Mycobacterium colombiense]OBJ35239.1 hypothetical protein A5621_17675 [Mycobacterium colombiense]OBJ47040.1 hypothetical protein A5620_06095 [Mycobacterium colombiense]OBJ67560.1 hypothetical protein A5627_03050 [Mycobacterium colombiense]